MKKEFRNKSNREKASSCLRRLLAAALSTLFVLSGIPASQAYADPGYSINWDINKSKTAEWAPSDQQDTAEVTLSLPAKETKQIYDVVFVLDDSSSFGSASETAYNNASDLVASLYAKTKEAGFDSEIRIGIVRYKGNAFDMMDSITDDSLLDTSSAFDSMTKMVKLTDESFPAMKAAFKVSKSDFRSKVAAKTHVNNGSNYQSGLQLADKWLSDEIAAGVSSDNIYVISYTDGLSYIWNDDSGKATSIYSQQVAQGSEFAGQVIYDPNNPVSSYGVNGAPECLQITHQDKYVSAYIPSSADPRAVDITSNIVKFYDGTVSGSLTSGDYLSIFNNILNSGNAELESSPYDVTIDWGGTYFPSVVTANSGHTTKYTITNAPSDLSSAYKQYYVADTSLYYTDSYLKAVPYKVGNFDDVAKTCEYLVDSETGNFIPNDEFYMFHVNALEKGIYKAGSLFKSMADKGYHMATIDGLNYGAYGGDPRYFLAGALNTWMRDYGDYGALSSASNSVFTAISGDMFYSVSKGSKVTDIMGDNFDFVDDLSKMTMTLGGTALDKVDLGSGTYGFGTPSVPNSTDPSDYPYVITYESASDSFIWSINKDISKLEPLQFTYGIKLSVVPTAVGTTVLDTNKSAVLTPKDSHGVAGDDEAFEIPQLNYVKAATPPPVVPDPFYTLSYDTNGGSAVLSSTHVSGSKVTLTAESEKTGYEFTGWYSDAECTEKITEVTMNSNKTVYAGWAIPGISRTVIKVWDDAELPDHRPDKITVRLWKDGAEFESKVLTEAMNWTFTWNDLDGTGEWTLTEDAVEYYSSSVDLSGDTFTVTNTAVVAPADNPDDGDDENSDADSGTVDGDDDKHRGTVDGDDDKHRGTVDGDDDSHRGTVDNDDDGANRLPQTGSLWWPVMLLALAGAGSLTAGLVLRRERKN